MLKKDHLSFETLALFRGPCRAGQHKVCPLIKSDRALSELLRGRMFVQKIFLSKPLIANSHPH